MAPSLQEIETLVAVDRHGSFVEAARRLGISQSAVSMQIRSLENDLGVNLFDRTVRPPVPTPVALAILPSARDVVARITDIRRTAAAVTGPEGVLRLGAIATTTHTLVPDALARTLRRHPGLRITVDTALSQDLLQRVVGRELDCAVITSPPTLADELHDEPIIRERLVMVAPAGESVARLDDVARNPFIRLQRRQGVGALVERLLDERGVTPDDFMELDSLDAVLAMVARGLGVAIVPELSVKPYLRSQVTVWPIDAAGAERTVSFVYRIDAPRPILLRSVADGLRLVAHRH